MTEDVWTPENSQQLVQKYMRVCGYLCSGKTKHEEAMSAGHTYAGQQNTKTQEDYAVEFAKGLKAYAIQHFGEYAVNTYLQSWHKPTADPIAAAAKLPSRQKLYENDTTGKSQPTTATHKTVEEWQAEGLRFRPAVARVALPKDEPQDNTPRARHLEHAQALHEAVVATGEGERAPWGQSAAAMAEWAWQVATGRKISVSQRTALADVLTVLYHAGIMPEGSIIPVGFWHKGHVRGAKRGK